MTLAMLCGWVSIAHSATDSSTVYVARRGWHIDVGVGVADLDPPLAAVSSASYKALMLLWYRHIADGDYPRGKDARIMANG